MFVERVPTYGYELPCGQTFRTHVKSVADTESGCHWFPCRRCQEAHCIKDETLRFMAPGKIGSLDEAIVKDRIVSDFRAGWCDVTIEELAERHGVSVRLVEYISGALGRRC